MPKPDSVCFSGSVVPFSVARWVQLGGFFSARLSMYVFQWVGCGIFYGACLVFLLGGGFFCAMYVFQWLGCGIFSGSVGSAMGAAIGPVTNRGDTQQFALTRPETDIRIDALLRGSVDVYVRAIDGENRLVLDIVASSASREYTGNGLFRYEVRIPRDQILMRQYVPTSE